MARNVPNQPKNPTDRNARPYAADVAHREYENAKRRYRAQYKEQGAWLARAEKFDEEGIIKKVDGFSYEYCMQQFNCLGNTMDRLSAQYPVLSLEA